MSANKTSDEPLTYYKRLCNECGVLFDAENFHLTCDECTAKIMEEMVEIAQKEGFEL